MLERSGWNSARRFLALVHSSLSPCPPQTERAYSYESTPPLPAFFSCSWAWGLGFVERSIHQPVVVLRHSLLLYNMPPLRAMAGHGALSARGGGVVYSPEDAVINGSGLYVGTRSEKIAATHYASRLRW
jgi:hypothetical protein